MVTSHIATPDDTQELPRLVLHTRRINPGEIKDLMVDATLCAYRLGGIGEWVFGNVTLVAVAKGNRIMVLFQPIPQRGMNYLGMWRELSEVRVAFYLPEVK